LTIARQFTVGKWRPMEIESAGGTTVSQLERQFESGRVASKTAAKRRKIAAHGASRGSQRGPNRGHSGWEPIQPRRGGRIVVTQTPEARLNSCGKKSDFGWRSGLPLR
jgi:hypothetical protein